MFNSAMFAMSITDAWNLCIGLIIMGAIMNVLKGKPADTEIKQVASVGMKAINWGRLFMGRK